MVLLGAGIQRAPEGKATFGTPDLEKMQDHCDPHRMQYKQTSPTLLSPTISHAPLFPSVGSFWSPWSSWPPWRTCTYSGIFVYYLGHGGSVGRERLGEGQKAGRHLL